MRGNQRAAVIGATGFVGRGLPSMLADVGILTTGVSRQGRGDVKDVDRWQTPGSLDLANHQCVVNLAGEPIDKRWSEKNRRAFHESRVGTTAKVVQAISKLPAAERPKVLVNASAVGIYGDRGDEILTEDAAPGAGYLADLCVDWEDAAEQAEALGVRVVRLRIGVVLGKNGGAFQRLVGVVKWGVGGPLGSGNQWMPWIHVHDLRAMIVHAILTDSISGSMNGSAPHPERNADLTKKLASALHRPAFLRTPAFALRLALGEFSTALLASHRAIPEVAQVSGFVFRYPTLASALSLLT